MPVDRALIEAVRDMRNEVQTITAKVKAAREVFNVENVALLDDERFAKEQVAAAEATLRAAALTEYRRTPDNKQPGPGLGIRIEPFAEYDPEKALEWAKDRRMALTLDVKAFVALAKAKADGTAGLVTFHDEPTVTIATDLAAALDQAGVPS